MVNSLRGLVSQRTLLSLLPFITDVDEEIAQLNKEQSEQMELYKFEPTTTEDFGVND